jgi:hypothetical protein
MSDDTQIILKTFQDYGKKFEELRPSSVLPYFHYPSLLISPDNEAAITNWFTGFVTFAMVMSSLKQRGYSHGKMPSLSARRLSNNLAIVSGNVIRYKQDHTELERFGLTYTLRKVGEDWKIIIGALHDPTP